MKTRDVVVKVAVEESKKGSPVNFYRFDSEKIIYATTVDGPTSKIVKEVERLATKVFKVNLIRVELLY